MMIETKYFNRVPYGMEEKSIEFLLAELKLQRNACIGMDLEGKPEAEQRLARVKLESLEDELLYTVARHVIEIEKEIAEMNKSDELPGGKSTYFIGE
jgi:hypothetical protein